MSWIITYTGKKFDILNPKQDMICVEDIAHALSNICRFTGHSKYFCSVAQHSILVSQLVPVSFKKNALLHDASEAYISDISRPLKGILNNSYVNSYHEIEKNIQYVIAKKYGDLPEISSVVKTADNIALYIEAKTNGLYTNEWSLSKSYVYEGEQWLKEHTWIDFHSQAKDIFLHELKKVGIDE